MISEVLILFSVILFVVGDVEIKGFICPEKDNLCKGPKDCVYQNPKSCYNYIWCNGSATFVKHCAPANPPLEWNDNKKECDYAPSPTCKTGFICPENDIAAKLCKEPNGCLYQNPETCYNFINCNRTGAFVKPCAPANPPLEWNDNKKECDYAPSPTCKRG